MKKTRAKFTVEWLKKTTDGSEIHLVPVTSGSAENESFFKWTPYGSIDIGVVNKEAVAMFEPGEEYYIDFVKVEV